MLTSSPHTVPLGLFKPNIIIRLHDGIIWLPLPECFGNFLSYFYSLVRIVRQLVLLTNKQK
jgi:hypothetical protein